MKNNDKNKMNDETLVISTDKGKEFTVGEIMHSDRIQKSVTPKFTPDWYIKWIASLLILIAMATRDSGLNLYEPLIPVLDDSGKNIVISVDIVFSILGTAGWLIVGLLWKDREIIVVNAVGTLLLTRTFIVTLVEILQ